jgi:hypothetical protein
MLYSEIIAICSQINTKHINTLCGQNVEFVNVKHGSRYIFTLKENFDIRGFKIRDGFSDSNLSQSPISNNIQVPEYQHFEIWNSPSATDRSVIINFVRNIVWLYGTRMFVTVFAKVQHYPISTNSFHQVPAF